MRFLRAVSLLLAIFLLCGLSACQKPTEPQKHDKFYYALLNTDHLTYEDSLAIQMLLASYQDHEIVTIDVKDCNDAIAIYNKLKADYATRENTLDGIQIFGTSYMVPSFWLNDKVVLPEGYSTDDAFASDYFYANLGNDAALFKNFSVADHFESDGQIDLAPKWRVARLALGAGEFSQYADNYRSYLGELKGGTPSPVCFSNPIFRHDGTSVDDMAFFLNRAVNEWKILDSAKLYANQQGDRPSSSATQSDCSAKAIKSENENGVCEFYFGGHGNQSELVRTVWKDNASTYETLLNWNNVPSLLDENPYYLNIWACNSAEGLDYNLVRAALNNGCLGAFASTTEFNNNGVSCLASAEELSNGGNFFYFYYTYLQARHNGLNRSYAFLDAQQKMQAALAAFSKQPINYGQNYQMVYSNLISYANLGILEPDIGEIPTFPAIEFEDIALPHIPKEQLSVSTGNSVGEKDILNASMSKVNGSSFAKIGQASAIKLDNDCIRLSLTVSLESSAQVELLKNLQQALLTKTYVAPKASEVELVMDIPQALLDSDTLIVAFKPQSGTGFVLWEISGLLS